MNTVISPAVTCQIYEYLHKSFCLESLDMYENECFCLLGHNGAGKTTSINSYNLSNNISFLSVQYVDGNATRFKWRCNHLWSLIGEQYQRRAVEN